ncbi:MAG: hypothetical protein A2286_00075 [Gammaproteobacteria bacterium RIFOXYA12_FULL_61_12]|nr:MAG: hypothetical protein A2514_11395 [Gammaproteobacteria bacterium RIFOXYD12_FULL_61_37]OGT90764.1 MAG: hypothetical protein A2286_00075 [Gammaproteobacteria bacterium RIFOXYA12_FULL_61_12]
MDNHGTPACCTACGREYEDLSIAEMVALAQTGACPSEECPGRDPWFAVIGRILGDEERPEQGGRYGEELWCITNILQSSSEIELA